jgi:hypothetical protein
MPPSRQLGGGAAAPLIFLITLGAVPVEKSQAVRLPTKTKTYPGPQKKTLDTISFSCRRLKFGFL